MDDNRATTENEYPFGRDFPQSGSSLLYVVAALVILSSLATAVSNLTSSAALTNLAGVNEQRAYYLALSGLNFWSNGKTGTYIIDGDTFTLTQSGPDAGGYYTITSLGSVLAGTTKTANVLLTSRRLAATPITFDDDIGHFSTPVVGQNTNNGKAIVVFSTNSPDAPASFSLADWTTLWSQNVYRYASGWVRLGGSVADTTGAIWYEGDKGACASGKCAFAKGLRTYFGFAFAGYDTSSQSKSYGDGFTFAVMTADNDPRYAAGGPASGSRGEYLGYAGPGPSGRGIASPKMAVEIDVYPNCNDGDPTENNSRRDATNANHVAAVYWGGTENSYDDNVHGAGAAPVNPAGGGTGYYERAAQAGGPNWLEDGQEHALRVEISRETDSGQGLYTIRAWVDPACAGKDDVTKDYLAESPQVSHTVQLGAVEHAKLDAVYFGWTEATGNHGQSVAIHDFALDFRR